MADSNDVNDKFRGIGRGGESKHKDGMGGNGGVNQSQGWIKNNNNSQLNLQKMKDAFIIN